MPLSDIVNVQITKATAGLTRVGFGTPLVLTYHTRFAERAKVYTSSPSMLIANGGDFESYDAAYILTNAIFSQNPRPPSVVVGRRVWPTIRTVRYTPLSGTIAGESYPRPLTDYVVTISRDGTEETFTYTSDATPTVAEITAGLVALINAGTVDVLAIDNTTTFDIRAAASPGGIATAGSQFIVSANKRLMKIEDNTPAAVGGALADEIAATINVNDDWYGIVGDWYGKIEAEDVALATESLVKIHGCAFADDEAYDNAVTDDFASVLQDLNLFRTYDFYHEEPETGIAAAIMGAVLPKDPGSVTWKFKTPASISTSSLTDGEKLVLKGKNANVFTSLAGLSFTSEGVMASGEFIDITHFIDWLQVRIQEAVFSLLKNADKVPFTDPGIAQVENQVRGVLNQGVSVGGIAQDPAFTVASPRASEVDPIDKANRLLPGVTFTATLAGAIHIVDPISGTVSV